MVDRAGYAGTAVAGDVYTAANHARMPGGWLGYARVESGQNTITTVVAYTGATVTVDLPADRLIKISFLTHVETNTADNGCQLTMRQAGSQIQLWEGFFPAANRETTVYTHTLIDSGVGGSVTFDMQIQSVGGTLQTIVSATQPALLIVEDLGPAPA